MGQWGYEGSKPHHAGGLEPRNHNPTIQKKQPNLLVVLGGGAEDGELWSAGFGFGSFTGVEEGLDEGLQVLPLLQSHATAGGKTVGIRKDVVIYREHYANWLKCAKSISGTITYLLYQLAWH